MAAQISTGLDGLDSILCNLRKGDNVVWQVDRIEDYHHFVRPYVDRALEDGRRLVYMRFARHEPLVQEGPDIKTYQLDAAGGFESFSVEVHNIISHEGLEAFYVFDCLSDLLAAWATDLMIGNFFRVTCPYLFELDTITYFAILRDSHSYRTIARIRDTTQLLLDVYDFEGSFCVHPLKVWNRYSPTMFLPHVKKENNFVPITSSLDVTRLLCHISKKSVNAAVRTLDYWDRLFMKAESLLEAPSDSTEVAESVGQLCRLIVGREKRISSLAQQTLSLQDLISIKNRLLGSGFIGGKAVGMLLAQKILLRDETFDWSQRLEPHDSFFVGADVFYSYIVENGWWKLLIEQKTPAGYFGVAPRLKELMLRGQFPDEIRQRFREMMDYFGQSPIIVRSSSLLEDSFGNAFAGKYESIFLVNQGDPEKRYTEFEEAVRRVYASTMDEDALTYRLKRRLDQQDEQMALLVQRVSGSHQKHYFFPDLAGVGVSYNTFVWKPHLDPKAGMIRLVFGLGTRAVDRVEDDYPQTIALDHPLLRPYSQAEDVMRFSQHNADVLDTQANVLTTSAFRDLVAEGLDIRLDLIATRDRQAERRIAELGLKTATPWILTFEKLLSKTDFTQVMQRLLKALESRYDYPVDVEFTVNFAQDGTFRINLVQCRPLQTKGLTPTVQLPQHLPEEQIFLASCGYTMGGGISQPIKQVIYVDPAAYADASLSQKYEVARTVGKLNRRIESTEATPTILLGPGRWGTTTPSLGVPVSFSEISNVTVLAELAYSGGNLMPELSFGTHFFQDLVEGDIFYVAIFPEMQDVTFNEHRLAQTPNLLTEMLPDCGKHADIVKVYDTEQDHLQIMCDVVSQRVICFFS